MRGSSCQGPEMMLKIDILVYFLVLGPVWRRHSSGCGCLLLFRFNTCLQHTVDSRYLYSGISHNRQPSSKWPEVRLDIDISPHFLFCDLFLKEKCQIALTLYLFNSSLLLGRVIYLLYRKVYTSGLSGTNVTGPKSSNVGKSPKFNDSFWHDSVSFRRFDHFLLTNLKICAQRRVWRLPNVKKIPKFWKQSERATPLYTLTQVFRGHFNKT